MIYILQNQGASGFSYWALGLNEITDSLEDMNHLGCSSAGFASLDEMAVDMAEVLDTDALKTYGFAMVADFTQDTALFQGTPDQEIGKLILFRAVAYSDWLARLDAPLT